MVNNESQSQFIWTLRELQYPSKLNASDRILNEQKAKSLGNKVAIFSEDDKVTYSELWRTVNTFGAALKAIGIKRGDRVLIRTLNIPEFIVSNLAILRVGAVSVPTMMLLRAREIAYIANDSEAKLMVVSSDLMEEVQKARDEMKTMKSIVLIGESSGDYKAKDIFPYEELLARVKEIIAAEETDKEDLALLIYTSGTTGLPKGCIYSHAQVLAAIDTYAKHVLEIRGNDVVGSHVSMAFNYGYHGIGTAPLHFEASASLIELGPKKFDVEKIFGTIQKHGITILFSVPTAYRLMLRAGKEIEKYDLSSLRLCVSGGEPLTAPVFEEWKRRFGVEIIEHLGTTEMNAICSSTQGKVKLGSCGLPVPGFELKLLTDDGRECSPGTPGNLAVRGPTGIRYWRKPEKQKEMVRSGWNFTGDVLYKDQEGYFWYVARTDDIIKSSAYRIAPQEVEGVLMEHPGVLEAGVVGVPDQLRGQRVKAFAALKEGYQPSKVLEEELKKFAMEKIAPYKAPAEIEFLEALPKGPTQKIRRAELRKLSNLRQAHG